MKKLIAVFLAFCVSSLALGQAPGPVVRGTLEGSTVQGWLPYSSGSGTGAVIATQQYMNNALSGYLPITGGTLTGALTVPQVNTALMQSNSGNTNGVQFPNNGNVLIAPNSVGQVFVGGSGNTLYGASINLVGDGVTTPSKIIQAKSGNLRVLADNGSTILWGLDNFGNESLTGGLNLLGDITAQANVNVKGTLSSTTNVLPAGPTNSGIALGGGPNYAIAQFFDQAQTPDNRTAEEIFISGGMTLRFKNDAGSLATPWLTGAGGYASGITGITSNSGSGAWSHTGPMNVSGQISGNPIQGAGYNWLNVAGAANGSSPSITTGGGNTNISLNVNTKGSGGIALNANTTVTGTLNATTAVQVNGISLLPVLTGTTGSIGGGLLVAGACTSGTVAVTNATTSMSVIATPVTYPGDGGTWSAYVSAPGVVTVKVCAIVAVTPTASAYNVRVIQ